MMRVAILGCSGSVGRQALEVCRRHADKLDVVGLAVNSSTDVLVDAAREFGAARVVVADEAHAHDPILQELPSGCELHVGKAAVTELAADAGVDAVVVAVVGFAGMRAAYAAAAGGKRLALANKESLVVAGDLIMPLVGPEQLIPVDSEHSAIFQCLVGRPRTSLRRIWLTCSGGPFFGWDAAALKDVTPEQALGHPTWHMGPKITIDSATLMNKGLEVIEAHHLFGVAIDDVEVLIHRESRIHSMVELQDASVIAQLADTSMEGPIQYALSYPDRWAPSMKRVDFLHEQPLTFAVPDTQTFRCLALALEAGRAGGTAPCVLNAAGEVANRAFREGKIGFLDIAAIVEKTQDSFDVEPVASLEQLDEIDHAARLAAVRFIDTVD